MLWTILANIIPRKDHQAFPPSVISAKLPTMSAQIPKEFKYADSERNVARYNPPVRFIPKHESNDTEAYHWSSEEVKITKDHREKHYLYKPTEGESYIQFRMQYQTLYEKKELSTSWSKSYQKWKQSVVELSSALQKFDDGARDAPTAEKLADLA